MFFHYVYALYELPIWCERRPDQTLRDKLAREAANICEAARTNIRNERQKAQKRIKSALDAKEMSKNDANAEGKQLEESVKAHTAKVDKIAKDAKSVLLDQ